MTRTISVVDYGCGNLFSVFRAVESLGFKPEKVSTAPELDRAEKVILPGVGAFASAMKTLESLELVAAIQKVAAENRPMLGICLGMQMLLETSEEFGIHKGLGIIPGKVCAIPSTTSEGRPHKIPHIGWNTLVFQGRNAENEDILAGISQSEAMYFVHSYAAMPGSEAYRVADCLYNGRRLSAVIRRGNTIGCQFHPEKSSVSGLKFLKNFCQL